MGKLLTVLEFREIYQCKICKQLLGRLLNAAGVRDRGNELDREEGMQRPEPISVEGDEDGEKHNRRPRLVYDEREMLHACLKELKRKRDREIRMVREYETEYKRLVGIWERRHGGQTAGEKEEA